GCADASLDWPDYTTAASLGRDGISGVTRRPIATEQCGERSPEPRWSRARVHRFFAGPALLATRLMSADRPSSGTLGGGQAAYYGVEVNRRIELAVLGHRSCDL